MRKLTKYESQQFMTDIYETEFGIYNHLSGPNKTSRPLAPIALHPAEDLNGIRTVNDLIALHVNKDIYKHTGLDLYGFLDLPHEQLNKLIEVVDIKVKKESTLATHMENVFKDK